MAIETIDGRPLTFKEHALDLAALGLAVFALAPKSKAPRKDSRGFYDATKDENTIREAWKKEPYSNIGIATGQPSGIIVLDCDSEDAFDEAAQRGLPTTWIVKTKRGYQVYFKRPDWPKVPTIAQDKPNGDAFMGLPDAEIKADGGYVVAPPSVHPDGPVYQWEVSPDEAELADPPPWLLDILRAKLAKSTQSQPKPAHLPGPLPAAGPDAGAAALVARHVGRLNASLQGSRNNDLNRTAYTLGGLVGAGRLDADEAAAMLEQTARAKGLSEREIEKTLASGLVDGIAKPLWSRERPPMHVITPRRVESDESDESDEPAHPAQPADEPRRSRFALVRATDFKNRPAPDCLVDGLLQVDTVNTLVGAWGSFKTFIALDIAASVATGTAWAGRGVKQGPVVYISAEGNAALGLRLKAWEIARRCSLDNAPFFILPDTVKLMDPAEVDELLLAIGDDVGQSPALVVVDTLARAMTGGDENSTRDMSLLVEGAERIRKTTGAVVLFIHHPAKNGNGGSRGSGALPGGIATEIKAEKSGNVVTLTCSKQKDLAEFEPFALTPRVVELDEEGNTSLVLDLAQSASLTPTQQRMLEALAKCGDAGATNTEWQAHSKANDVGRSMFFAQRPGLLTLSYVRLQGAGKSARYYVTEKSNGLSD